MNSSRIIEPNACLGAIIHTRFKGYIHFDCIQRVRAVNECVLWSGSCTPTDKNGSAQKYSLKKTISFSQEKLTGNMACY